MKKLIVITVLSCLSLNMLAAEPHFQQDTTRRHQKADKKKSKQDTGTMRRDTNKKVPPAKV